MSPTMTPPDAEGLRLRHAATDAAKEEAEAVVAAALARPDVTKLRDRADRLTSQLDAARVEHGRATAEYDRLAGLVRVVMLDEGDVAAAERARDDAHAAAGRLKARVDDLAAAAHQAGQEATEAAQGAVFDACRKQALEARRAVEAATAELAATRERHRRELAAAELANFAASARVAAPRDRSGAAYPHVSGGIVRDEFLPDGGDDTDAPAEVELTAEPAVDAR